MKNKLLLIILSLSFVGCIPRKKLIHGLTCEYYSLATDKNRVIFGTENFKEIPLDSSFYTINGNVLLEDIKENEKSLVYLWDPRCGGEYCYSLKWIEEYSSNKGIKFYAIPIFIDIDMMDIHQGITTPITPIDFKFYKSIFCSRYIKKFLNDVVNKENEVLFQNKGRYFWIEKDSLIDRTIGIQD